MKTNNTVQNKTMNGECTVNKLDEILKKNLLDRNVYTITESEIDSLKQAIIELIGEEIIGEDEATEFCHDDRELDERYARNFVRYIQRQKLAKLKE